MKKLVPVLAILALAACGSKEDPAVIRAAEVKNGVVLARGEGLPEEIVFHRKESSASPVRVVDPRPWYRFSVPRELEVLNIPVDWTRIELRSEGSESGKLSMARESLRTVEKVDLESVRAENSSIWLWWLIVKIVIALVGVGFFLLGVGLAETQFGGDSYKSVLIGCFFAALIVCPRLDWALLYAALFPTVLVAGVVFYYLAGMQVMDPVFRILYGVAIVALGVLFVLPKEGSDRVEWVRHDSIKLHIPKAWRHEIELLDEEEKGLGTFRLESGYRTPSILYWPDEATPVTIRVSSEEGEDYVRRLGSRPDPVSAAAP